MFKYILYYLKNFLLLIRINKPTGIMLLTFPAIWSILIVLKEEINLFLILLFIYGSFIMRSAGCIINDIIDLKFDKKEKRTKDRPLASGQLEISDAILLCIIFLSIGLSILLQLNLISILLGLFVFPLILLYPLMKRFFYAPQLFLAIVFNFSVLISWTAAKGAFELQSIILYLGCIFWTLGYDTIYAYQDREDDIKNNIKSTAVLFGNNGKQFVLLFYIFFLSIIGYVSFDRSNTTVGIAILFLFSLAILFFLNKWDINSSKSSNKYFKFNNIIGIFCFIYLIIF